MKKVAVLGARGYIGRSLVEVMQADDRYQIVPYSRSGGISGIKPIAEFNEHVYDVVINCTGIGDPMVLKSNPAAVFQVTEEMDALLLNYIKKNPATLCIHLSSGAVYNNIDANSVTPADFYSLAKIHSEAKHRAEAHLPIVDLRIFSFFSHLVDPNLSFFISDVIRCIQNKHVLETDPLDIMRDYITPKDLCLLINCVIQKENLNDFFDVYSIAPISKFELLRFFESKYDLKYVIKNDEGKNSPTGIKAQYFSKNKKAESLGYLPQYSSLTGIESEMDKIHFTG
jgi:nucleoside-diphosphate-sugar epimerase